MSKDPAGTAVAAAAKVTDGTAGGVLVGVEVTMGGTSAAKAVGYDMVVGQSDTKLLELG